MKAVWNGVTLAESDETRVVETNHYVPPETLNREYVRDSDKHTHCGWKGEASYFHVVVDGELNEDAAWYYPECKEAAREIEGYVVSWRGVEVTA